jgi:hypothetical protein
VTGEICMPATIDGLSADLRRFFEDKLPRGDEEGPGAEILLFDALGFPLSTREFTGPESAAPSEVYSRQRAAELADQLPSAGNLATGNYMPRSGSRLSDWYANMVSSSSSVGPGFELIKSESVRKLENNRLVVVGVGVVDTRYATSMTPADFYKPSFDGWQQYSIKAGDEPPPDSPPGPPIPYIPYHEGPDEGSVQPGRPHLMHVTLGEPLNGINDRFPALPIRTISSTARELTVNRIQVTPSGVLSTSIADAPVHSSVPLLHAEESRPSLEELLSTFDPMMNRATEEALLRSTTAVSSTSGNFAVRFEYCLVRFDRPWWNELFVTRTDWRIEGVGRGKISSGSLDASGPISLVTTGMLVVRKLSITAQWSEADLSVLPNSLSLGPFCLVAGSFKKDSDGSGSIIRAGLQVIAWTCQVPPLLPPSN